MSQQIVILAAGKGTRMGVDIPKVLLPLGDRPVISHLLDTVATIPQATAPVIVVGFQKELVEQTLGSAYLYVTQFDQKGTAHAVLSAKSAITADSFIVLYGDMPFTSKQSLQNLIAMHAQEAAKVSMFTCKVPNFENEHDAFLGYGRIIRNSDGYIQKVVEYKDCAEEQKDIQEVNPGVYMFNSAWLWDKLEAIGHSNAQDEFYLTDIVELAIADGQVVHSMLIEPREVYGINTPQHLEHARSVLGK